LKLSEFVLQFFQRFIVSTHGSRLFVGMCGGPSLFVDRPRSYSVIEEKGEGFKNGTKQFLAACGSAFNLKPSYTTS
jgi:hypothetical protein